MIAFQPLRAARLLALAFRGAAFDPGQPRDDGGKWTSLDAAVGHLDREKVHLGIGPVKVKGYRIGPTDDRGRGVFFGGDAESIAPYASLHEGHSVREFDLTATNPVVAPHVFALHKELFKGKSFQDAVFLEEKKTGFTSSINAAFKVEVKIAKELKKRGFDAIIYTKPPAPAKNEIALLKYKPLKTLAVAKYPIRQIADAAEPRISIAVSYAMHLASAQADPRAGVDVMAASLGRTLPRILARCCGDGASAAAGMVPELRDASELRALKTKPRAFRFATADPEATAWAKEHAGILIKDISETTRKRIRSAITEFKNSKESYDAIRAILRDPERAALIARTESMIAAHAGQRMAWQRAQEEGYLGAGAKAVWIATPDEAECAQCQALDGEKSPVGRAFSDGTAFPPAHPRCRCTLELSA